MDETELHLNIESRLSQVEARIMGMEDWVSKLEKLIQGVARVDDIQKLMEAVKGKNGAILAATISGFFGLAGVIFGLLKP